MIKRTILFLLLVVPTPSISSDFGITGLIDIPNARMSEDGNLRTVIATQDRHRSTSVTYQITPWLEGTFRYTGFKYGHWDRNYEVKARLWEETDTLPQVSLGIRDLVGTGLWGSEYIVASKQFGDLDLTLGMGWGRLAGDGDLKNPLVHISERFISRRNDYGRGGKLSTNTFFSGENAGFFGGLDYSPSNLPISFILEYNPDEYLYELGRKGSEPKSHLSTALKWKFNQGSSLSLSYKNLEEWSINVSSNFNTKSLPSIPVKQKFISSIDIPKNKLPSQLNKNKWYDMLLYDVERSGILLLEATINKNSNIATIVMANPSYFVWADAIGNMIELADFHLPTFVSGFNIVIEENGFRLHTVIVDRASAKKIQKRELLSQNVEITLTKPLDFVQYKTTFPKNRIFFNYNLSFRTQLFDPDDPLRYQLFAKLGMSLRLEDNWLLRGVYAQNITHNFDESRRGSNSVLPRVRTDIVRYLNEGESGIDSLFLEKRGNINSDTYYRVYGGILEHMFSGIGGEILHHPFQSRFAYGLSTNIVRQRDYDRSLGHRDYETMTGFASIYYASPFHNLDFALHTGKYLAKDIGSTLEVRRTFNNGWMVGVWATITDVSAEDFGEGSFDKGMYFSIPFSELLREGKRDSFRTGLRPVQRDGGQRLEDFSGNIWWDIRDASYDAFIKNKTKSFFSGFSTEKKTKSDQNLFKRYYKEK